uniref:Uncharacterized protein n=2 Tax=Aegilops tauschii subsp. strangulata TaxID=200361 RepID=A0A453K0L5_AEGTS
LTLECVRILIQSCQILVLVLNGADFFDDEGMMVLSSSPFLETLELAVNDQKLDSLTIEGCACISPQVAQGAARSVHYSLESASRSRLSRI